MKIAANAALLALSLAFGNVLAADAPAAATPGAVLADTTRVEAEVVGVDKKSRTVTLKGPEGNVFDVTVGKEVKNLPDILPLTDKVIDMRRGERGSKKK